MELKLYNFFSYFIQLLSLLLRKMQSLFQYLRFNSISRFSTECDLLVPPVPNTRLTLLRTKRRAVSVSLSLMSKGKFWNFVRKLNKVLFLNLRADLKLDSKLKLFFVGYFQDMKFKTFRKSKEKNVNFFNNSEKLNSKLEKMFCDKKCNFKQFMTKIIKYFCEEEQQWTLPAIRE